MCSHWPRALVRNERSAKRQADEAEDDCVTKYSDCSPGQGIGERPDQADERKGPTGDQPSPHQRKSVSTEGWNGEQDCQSKEDVPRRDVDGVERGRPFEGKNACVSGERRGVDVAGNGQFNEMDDGGERC